MSRTYGADLSLLLFYAQRSSSLGIYVSYIDSDIIIFYNLKCWSTGTAAARNIYYQFRSSEAFLNCSARSSH